MIDYEPRAFPLWLLFRLHGSVFPRAILWAVPSTALAIILHAYVIEYDADLNLSQFGIFNFVLGFLLVFRSQQAYNRFWEAGTIIQRVRGNWFNCFSACCAFCSTKPENEEQVRKFKHSLVRFTSLLYCSALQQLAVCKDAAFEVIDLEDFPEASLKRLAEAPEKTLVVIQWMQQLITDNQRNGTLDVPPPILSRVFQELSNGSVDFVDAMKITDVLFPFPYTQMISTMLILCSVITPVILAAAIHNVVWVAVLTFCSTFFYWCIDYIAAEIEMPYGDDPNDLPMASFQQQLNRSLCALMDNSYSTYPDIILSEETNKLKTSPCPFYLVTDTSERQMPHLRSRAGKILKAVEHEARKMTLHPSAELSTKIKQAARHNWNVSRDPALRLTGRTTQHKLAEPPAVLEAASTPAVPAKEALAQQEGVDEQQVHPLGKPLDELLQRAGDEISGQLAEMAAIVQKHVATVTSDLQIIALHHANERLGMGPKETEQRDPLIPRVSAILDEQLSTMVLKLDKMALDLEADQRVDFMHRNLSRGDTVQRQQYDDILLDVG